LGALKLLYEYRRGGRVVLVPVTLGDLIPELAGLGFAPQTAGRAMVKDPT
jgi:hypothetical protein